MDKNGLSLDRMDRERCDSGFPGNFAKAGTLWQITRMIFVNVERELFMEVSVCLSALKVEGTGNIKINYVKI